MFFESAVIVLIISAVTFGFMRQKKTRYAKATIPIIIVPLVNIIINAFSDIFESNQVVDWNTAIVVSYIISFLISMVLILKEVKGFPSKNIRRVYVATVGIFLFLLIYVFTKANLVL